LNRIEECHFNVFGSQPDGVYRAPGRVNLIGEHTDYNEGYVLPTPISRHVVVSVNKRDDNQVNLYAHDFNDKAHYSLGSIGKDLEHLWANYVLGICSILIERGFNLTGFDMTIAGDVPIGVGLSSSAALETAILRGLIDQFQIDIDPVEAAYVGRECEHRFIGVQSGIMDQFVSGLGEHGKALFLDCRSNKYSLHPIPPEVSVVIVNTRTSRTLAGSEYNLRRSQCLEAVRIIRKKYPFVRSLRDVSEEILIEQWGRLPEVAAWRARHVVTENQRVLDSLRYLKNGNMEAFGELMYESHDSLHHDYEVSSKHLDLLVDYTMDLEGVYGARMTGAGFGGCTVNLVAADYVDEFMKKITERYFNRTAKRCEIYLA